MANLGPKPEFGLSFSGKIGIRGPASDRHGLGLLCIDATKRITQRHLPDIMVIVVVVVVVVVIVIVLIIVIVILRVSCHKSTCQIESILYHSLNPPMQRSLQLSQCRCHITLGLHNLRTPGRLTLLHGAAPAYIRLQNYTLNPKP